MYYVVEFKTGDCWFKAKQTVRCSSGTSAARVIRFDTRDETDYTVKKYESLGYEVRVKEVKCN